VRRRDLPLLGLAVATALFLEPLRRASARVPLLEPSASLADARLPAPIARALTFGFQSLAADYYWLAAIQYYGDFRNDSEAFRGLPGILEQATDLDPLFGYAYQFAGQTCPSRDRENHVWHNILATTALLQKGIDAGVDRWQVPWLLGYTLFTFQGDYAAAGKAMRLAAELPQAPRYLGSLATRLLAQGGETETAIAFTKGALAQTSDPRVRAELEDRLRSLQLQEDLLALNRRGDQRTSPLPEIDPYGDPYIRQPDGTFVSKNASHLLHLQLHPGEPSTETFAD
jgi:hypothetical protein